MTNATDAETRVRAWIDSTPGYKEPSDEDLRTLLASLATLRGENEQLAIGARGAIQVAAMMLVKLGGSATFTALDQVAIQGKVTRTDGPMGEYTLTLDAARSGATP